METEGFLRCTVRGWYNTDEKNFETSAAWYISSVTRRPTRASRSSEKGYYWSVITATTSSSAEMIRSELDALTLSP